jgi:uncharacterized glyoxalase superfamily metalloenzyme YdcJ
MLVSSDQIRSRFSSAMSSMYRAEVPLYGQLLDLVADVNREHPAGGGADASRIAVERHGAIRLGTAEELRTMRRVLGVMGMEPVGYYDLSVAGIPVHATAFRPVRTAALEANPFRLFTSLLRLEMIDDVALRARAADILSRRRIFSPRLLALLSKHEADGGLGEADAEAFVHEAVQTFRWHEDAPISGAEYEQLLATHGLVADIVGFKGPHINHLTPRTLDIDVAQAEMRRRGIPAKAQIEGPPARRCPILLRQTSFKALEERVRFGSEGDRVEKTHTARFGEIEQRDQALTRAGRALYDQLLAQSRRTGEPEIAFQAFPDDLDEIRRQKLGFFRYRLTQPGRESRDRWHGENKAELDRWIDQGWVRAEPIVYEDFLPVSAAGIFRSNLGEDIPTAATPAIDRADRAAFEAALGVKVLDEFELYAREEADSLAALQAALSAHTTQGDAAENT